jgi:prepilin-type N-terminal cleavage/methylation domain-containing protein
MTPATRRHPAARRAPPGRAFTLPELVVALAVGGVAFGAFAHVVAGEERAHADLARRGRADAQVREGIAALAADLRVVSPAAGDIPPGGARDSSIELRSTVGTAIVCERRDRALVVGLASFVGPPEAGDTVWAYVDTDSGAAWVPLVTVGIQETPADAVACPFPAAATDLLDQRPARRQRHAILLAAIPDTAAGFIDRGTPLRVSRRVRYSLYRAPDGRWYLGRRAWSASRGRFESIQPVSGPYRAYATADRQSSGLQLEYFDARGAPVESGAGETDRIARVVITLRSAVPRTEPGPVRPGDLSVASIAFRNRP